MRRRHIYRGICCLRSSPTGFRPIASVTSAHETRQMLDRTDATDSSAAMSMRLVSLDQKRTELTPGTVLVRDWDFAWIGQTHDSLSKVALAITGTKWNGPRFFGLRDKGERSVMTAQT
jgi:hypothetical protein